MASCYGDSGEAPVNRNAAFREGCSYLPLVKEINVDGESRQISLDVFQIDNEHDMEQGMKLMNDVIEEGKTWPFDAVFPTMASFFSYFHSHASFAVHFADQDMYGSDLLGCFYIKPNFPGRCSHVCNGGFITNPQHRGLGVGTFMGENFKILGKDLGFKSSLFNLVFANNMASVKLWRKLGYTELSCIPKVAQLNGSPDLVDAYQFHCDFLQLNNHNGEESEKRN